METEEELTPVPPAEEMDNDIFLKHIDKRHSHQTGVEPTLHKSAHIHDSWVNAYRAFHDLKHRTEPWNHDHEHVWDE